MESKARSSASSAADRLPRTRYISASSASHVVNPDRDGRGGGIDEDLGLGGRMVGAGVRQGPAPAPTEPLVGAEEDVGVLRVGTDAAVGCRAAQRVSDIRAAAVTANDDHTVTS